MPPTIGPGIVAMSAANFGQNESRIAKTAAMRTTTGLKTRESARTPVFSP